MKLFFFALLMLAANGASACQFDTDCAVGSTCKKADYQIYGICENGMNPGNDNDRSPVYDPLDPNHTTGDTCQFDTDCGPGSECAKGEYQIKGVCKRH